MIMSYIKSFLVLHRQWMVSEKMETGDGSLSGNQVNKNDKE